MGETNSSEANPGLTESQNNQRQVGSYILEQKLGEGGMAQVWKARHQVLGTYVAIKFLSSTAALIPDVESRFLEEGKRQARLFHPNIISAYDFLYIDGRSYLVMKLVEGESLDELMFRLQAPVPLPQVLEISTDVLHALEYAHKQNVVHRDIKPSNIMVEKGGCALLMDFGVALVMGEKRTTRVGVAVGTPHYMSPEQILGSANIDRRADIYGFGCVLYQMLTGKAPFEAGEGEEDTDFLIQDKHVRQQAVPPRQWNPYIPEHIERAVLRCLEKKAEDRFISAQDLLAALTKPPLEAEAQPRTNTLIETTPPRGTTVVESARPRRETLIETAPQRNTVIETSGVGAQEALDTNTAQSTEASPTVVVDSVLTNSKSILWLVVIAIVSAALVGGGYWYFHRPKPEPAPIVNPNPIPPSEPVAPKPSPDQVDTQPPEDQTPPPVNPPITKQDDTSPVLHTPEKPVDQTPLHPNPDTKTPDTNPTTPIPTEPTPRTAPITPPVTPPQRHYASEGNLIWSGQIDKNQIIQISGSGANIGNLAGDPFPGGGVPIEVSVNNNKFAVISQPNPINQFSQISLRSTLKGNIVVVIHWKVLPSE